MCFNSLQLLSFLMLRFAHLFKLSTLFVFLVLGIKPRALHTCEASAPVVSYLPSPFLCLQGLAI
jgi:hypothetical protein